MITSTLSPRYLRRLDFNLLVGLPQVLLSNCTAMVGTLFIFWVTQATVRDSATHCISVLSQLWLTASCSLIVVRNLYFARFKRIVAAGVGIDPTTMPITSRENILIKGQQVNFGKAIPQRAAAAIVSGLIWGAAGLLFFNVVTDDGRHYLLLALVTLTFTSMPSLCVAMGISRALGTDVAPQHALLRLWQPCHRVQCLCCNHAISRMRGIKGNSDGVEPDAGATQQMDR
ncbi:hypothetical protein KTQ42_20265 [Noviherbaspirillum sp. L7-7A]|uniref:hypothetical protein n=1 Tax=Noviherbaspirillum sp. L7-7A TaxID=2850560 RepID=UPI001C2C3E70|nr:hypothetical protein [Noviherbaspirillum sp. L7-7A]MBV0881619.1 hypothetical protein [Noviherbaspirillum sp. L7-7A]